jgi:hypothetical protein
VLPGPLVGPAVQRADGLQPPAQCHRGGRDSRRGAEGVRLTQAGYAGGYVLYIQDRRLRYVHNYVAKELFEVVSEQELPTGAVTLRYEFEVTTPPQIREGRGAGGLGQLYFDGRLVANTEIPYTVPIFFGVEGLSCGYDPAAPVVPTAYQPPFTFTGTVHRVR